MDTPSPDKKTLLDYLQGKLSDAESEQIAQLVAENPEIRAQLEKFDASDDTFIDMLRQDVENTPTEGYSEYGEVLDRAKQIFDDKNRWISSLSEGENPVGTLGEYQLTERIGQGGMGVVFKAQHTKLGRTVAIKVIVETRAGDDRAIARFEREIKAIGQLNHPSIVHAHDAREIDGRSVLVMEYVDGMDLGRLIRRHGPISTADACELIRQTAIGLQAAHEHGLVHRDIKPSNLMLDRCGNLKILDLGLAREATNLKELRREVSFSFDLTQTGQAMGTADYMAPEQADHPGMVDIRADIYSLGCTLFKLLTSRAPYHEEMTFDKLAAHAEIPLPPTPELPAPLRAILERMTAKNPDDRFDTPEEVAKALEPFCTGHDLADLLTRAEAQTAPAHTLPHPAAGGRFRRIITILLLMAFAGGFGLFGGILLTIHRNGKKTTIEIPDGSDVAVNENGDVTVDLDKASQEPVVPDGIPSVDLTPYQWTEEDFKKSLAAIQKAPYAVITFESRTSSNRKSPFLPSWVHNYPELLDYREFQLEPAAILWQKHFGVSTSTTIFLKDGKEIFREKGNVDSDAVSKKILSHLPPIRLDVTSFWGDESGANLTITNQPGQTKRWAGKTLQITWPKGFEVGVLTSGYEDRKEQSVEWPISKDAFANQELFYQIKLQTSSSHGDAEFCANLLNNKGEVESSIAIKRDIQTNPAPVVKPPQIRTPEDANAEALQQLIGTWQCVSCKQDGRPIQPKYVKNTRELKLVIEKKHLTFIDNRGEDKAPFTIDTTTTPKQIDSRSIENGIYKIDGNRLTICLSPDGNRPSTFVANKNSPKHILMVFERASSKTNTNTPHINQTSAGASLAANGQTSPRLDGTWKLVERPNRDGCLIFTGEKEKTPVATVTFTKDKLYLRGEKIVNRQFAYEVSPDGKNINLLDGRNQIYRGVISFENNGKRLIFVCGKKERPAGSWEYFGTDYDRLVLENRHPVTSTTTDPFASDKSLTKKWFIMSTRPNGALTSSSVTRLFTMDNGKTLSLLNSAIVDLSPTGHMKFGKAPYFDDGNSWPKRFAYDIDPSTSPKRIDVVTNDNTALKGIYKTEGDRLYLRFVDQNHARQKDFETPLDDDLIELELCCPVAPTPELATLFVAPQGLVFDGNFTANPAIPQFHDSGVSLITKQLEKYPEMQVVIDSPYSRISLISLRRKILDKGAKSVKIKLGNQPSWLSERIYFCLLKNLPKIYDIPAHKFDALTQQLQLPTPCSVNRQTMQENKITTRGGSGGYCLQDDPNDTISGQPLWVKNVEVLPDTIRVMADPKVVEQIKTTKLDSSEQIAIVVNDDLVIAVTTLKALQNGSFDINSKPLTEEERKIFIETLRSAKEPQYGGMMGGGGMF